MDIVSFGGCCVELYQAGKSLRNLVEEIANSSSLLTTKDPFIVGDLGDVIYKYKQWRHLLPRVTPFYAVKCNDSYEVLKLLADLGTCFDCSSQLEIQKVLDLGVDPSRIIYANTCKQTSFLRFAKAHNVSLMTFDNEAELHKIKDVYPEAKLLLRILPSTRYEVKIDLGKKFGCLPSRVHTLFETARALQLNIVGVSFHVGTGCTESKAFSVAIEQARSVLNIGRKFGFNMEIVDIGGGFPGYNTETITIAEVTHAIYTALEEHFPDKENIRVIAEPGRYFVASAFTTVTNIIAKRVEDGEVKDGEGVLQVAEDKRHIMYYVNDGIYGTFSNVIYEDQTYDVSYIKKQHNAKTFSSSVWGPTCCSHDCVLKEVQLPNLDVHDWLYFPNNGAYSTVCASRFNSMQQPKCYYVCRADVWYEVYGDTIFKDVGKVESASQPEPKDGEIPLDKAPALESKSSEMQYKMG